MFRFFGTRKDLILERLTHMSQQLTDLTTQVHAVKGAADSAVALITGLHAKLVEVLAASDQPAALQALADELAGAKQAIADAVTANPLPVDATTTV